MNDAKRYAFQCRRTGIELDAAEDEEGMYVTYTDHVAALARVEEARYKAIVVEVGRKSAETYYFLCQEIEDLKKENAELLLKIEEMQH